MTKNGKSAIYVLCKGTVEDIYLLVHEILHTFDLGEKDNSTRNLLGEVTSYCFEAMLSRFLTENGILNREDVTNREKGDIINCYDDAVETFAKLKLMRIKEQKGNIRQTDISEIWKATINVPTNSKDEAKFHIAHTEKLLIQDDKNDNLLK